MTEPGTHHLETGRIGELADELRRRAEVLRGLDGGLDRDVPAVPFDTFGLQARLRELADEHQRFEERLARLVAGGAEQAEMQVTYTETADR